MEMSVPVGGTLRRTKSHAAMAARSGRSATIGLENDISDVTQVGGSGVQIDQDHRVCVKPRGNIETSSINVTKHSRQFCNAEPERASPPR
jgi:hypothetical protein